MLKITPFLWFDHQAEEAAKFYTPIFKNSKLKSVSRYGEAGAEASGRKKGTAMTVSFDLEGQEFVALNGGPLFTFSPAISFVVNCETQVLPGIENDSADWIGAYGRVAMTGEAIRLESYSEALERWYSVLACSCERNYFVTVFEEITERKWAEERLREAEEKSGF